MVWGSQSKTILVRALGPTLGSYGVANVLSDPMLELHDSSGATIATNDDWQTGSQASQISSSGYAPNDSNEPALIATLAAGSYTVVVRGFNNSTGIGLVEVYELDTVSSRLSNISTRGQVGTDQSVLIAGLIIDGSTSKKLIIRALGPSLAAPPFSLTGTLSNPVLELHAFGVSFGRAREVGDETVEIFGRERANAKLRESSVTKTHMIRHWQGGTL